MERPGKSSFQSDIGSLELHKDWSYLAQQDKPPGTHGGQPPKKVKKVRQTVLCKAVQEHWANLPEALRTQCEALGVQVAAPPPPQDLPALIKEHLQSLPSELKEAVEKIVEPTKPEPTLASKLKMSVQALRQLSDRKRPFRPRQMR